jgi:epoxide hydrolase
MGSAPDSRVPESLLILRCDQHGYVMSLTNLESRDARPFRIAVPQQDLDDLNLRLERTRWPDEIAGIGWTRGVPTAYLRSLADYWRTGFDWRDWEARLNDVPQFTTEFDGQTVHFFHVGSPEPDARPLIMTHGWPSSPLEFWKVVGPLTDPRAHGGDPADAFHLVLPSLPGYGFSNPVRQQGWGNLFNVAQVWHELMGRLGYERYAVHGTDVGSGVALLLPMVAGSSVIGVHINGPSPAMPLGPALDPDGLTGTDRDRAKRFNKFQSEGMGYLQLQATRPQTIGYALNDSPVGQLAWIVEKFAEWTDPATELPEDAVDRDQILATVTLFWLTGSGAASAHGTYEGMQAYREFMAETHSDDRGDRDDHGGDGIGRSDDGEVAGWAAAGPPMAVAVFAGDNSIRSLTDPTQQMRWTEFDRGGHFPAMEVPELLVGDVREFFRSLR